MNRLKQLFFRHRRYDELSESIREHLDEKIADLMDRGMTREQAERIARREFGNVTRIEERSREVWQWPGLEGTIRDARYGLRSLCKSPGFTIAVLLTLGLGIGASIAVYSLADAVLLRPLQFKNEKRLVDVFEDRPALGLINDTPAPANYFDWKRRNHVFSEMAAADGDIFTITGNGRPQEVDGSRITSNMLPLLGIEPTLGRNFIADEDKPGNKVTLISAALWEQRYGSDPHVVGRTIHLNGVAYRIVGVMPFGFSFPQRSSLWIPLALTTSDQLARDDHYLLVYGLLRPGITIQAARQEMADISTQLEHEYPATNRGLTTSVLSLREQLLGRSRLAIFVLAFGVAILLLITCVSIAGLLASRAASRQHEMAVRVALGARRLQLLRQTLAEGSLLVLGGSVFGVAFALATMPLMRHFVPQTLALWARPQLNWAAALFTVMVGSVTALAFGLLGQRPIPKGPIEALREGSRGSTDSRQKLRSILVTIEIALTTVVLTSTGILGGALWKLVHTELGFNPDSVLTVRTQLPISAQTPYHDFSARVSFYKRVLASVEHLPGVTSAGYTTFLPFTNPGGSSSVLIYGAPALPTGKENDIKMRVVTPEYFHALEMPLVKGRFFTEADGNNPMPMAVINQKMAQQYWPNNDAIGKRFRFDQSSSPWIRVIGVVGDVHYADAETPAHAEMYFSYEQNLDIPGYFHPHDLAIRVAGDPIAYANTVEHAVWSVDPEQPVSDVQSMRHLVDSRMETYILEAKLFTFFSCTALLLSALGIYGLMSYSVKRRTQEIGIRMALGAQPTQVLASFIGGALRLLFIGLAFGAIGSFAATRLLGNMVAGIPGIGWSAAAIPLLSLGGVVILAAYIPARRASAIDPMQALRSE
ncbi:MAG: ABC transporter permease [Acidobacteriaceae bacterium]